MALVAVLRDLWRGSHDLRSKIIRWNAKVQGWEIGEGASWWRYHETRDADQLGVDDVTECNQQWYNQAIQWCWNYWRGELWKFFIYSSNLLDNLDKEMYLNNAVWNKVDIFFRKNTPTILWGLECPWKLHCLGGKQRHMNPIESMNPILRQVWQNYLGSLFLECIYYFQSPSYTLTLEEDERVDCEWFIINPGHLFDHPIFFRNNTATVLWGLGSSWKSRPLV